MTHCVLGFLRTAPAEDYREQSGDVVCLRGGSVTESIPGFVCAGQPRTGLEPGLGARRCTASVRRSIAVHHIPFGTGSSRLDVLVLAEAYGLV